MQKAKITGMKILLGKVILCLEGIVVIPEGVTVQIRKGVKVKAIEVKGTLIISGNETEIDVEVETIYVAAREQRLKVDLRKVR